MLCLSSLPFAPKQPFVSAFRLSMFGGNTRNNCKFPGFATLSNGPKHVEHKNTARTSQKSRPTSADTTQAANWKTKKYPPIRSAKTNEIKKDSLPVSSLMSMYLNQSTLAFLKQEEVNEMNATDEDEEVSFDARKTIYMEEDFQLDETKVKREYEPNPELVHELQGKYVIGQHVSVQVTRIGYTGCTVMVDGNDKYTGIIVQTEMLLFESMRGNANIQVNETLVGFIQRIRPDTGFLYIALRPIGQERAQTIQDMVYNTLLIPEHNNVLPIGDKSSVEEINKYFKGITKTEFKMAVSRLYKESKLIPAAKSIRLMSEEERKASLKLQATKRGYKEHKEHKVSSSSPSDGNWLDEVIVK